MRAFVFCIEKEPLAGSGPLGKNPRQGMLDRTKGLPAPSISTTSHGAASMNTKGRPSLINFKLQNLLSHKFNVCLWTSELMDGFSCQQSTTCTMFDIDISKLAEARQFRDLGYYSRASVCFEESDYERTDLVLAIGSSGFLV